MPLKISFFDLVLGSPCWLSVLGLPKKQNGERTCRKSQTQSKKKKVFPNERKMETDAVSPSITLLHARFLLKNRHSICFELFVTWLLSISMPYFAFCSLLIVLHNLHSAKVILIHILMKV